MTPLESTITLGLIPDLFHGSYPFRQPTNCGPGLFKAPPIHPPVWFGWCFSCQSREPIGWNGWKPNVKPLSLDSVQRLGLGGLEREEWLGPEISVRRCWTVEVLCIVFFLRISSREIFRLIYKEHWKSRMCHSKIEVKRALLDMRYATKSLEKSRVQSKSKILWPLKLIYLTYIIYILHIVFAPDKILRKCTKTLGIQPFKAKVPASAVTETAVALQDVNNKPKKYGKVWFPRHQASKPLSDLHLFEFEAFWTCFWDVQQNSRLMVFERWIWYGCFPNPPQSHYWNSLLDMIWGDKIPKLNLYPINHGCQPSWDP